MKSLVSLRLFPQALPSGYRLTNVTVCEWPDPPFAVFSIYLLIHYAAKINDDGAQNELQDSLHVAYPTPGLAVPLNPIKCATPPSIRTADPIR
jgi:hypothetical protein